MHSTSSSAQHQQQCTAPSAVHSTSSSAQHQQQCTAPSAVHSTSSSAQHQQQCNKRNDREDILKKVQSGSNDLLPPCKINTTHNIKFICFEKPHLLHFRYFQTILVIKFVKLHFVYLQRFKSFKDYFVISG